MLTSESVANGSAGRVALPGEDAWEAGRRAFNVTLDPRPAAVAFPASEREVAAVVRLARDRDLQIATQATGHNAGPHRSLTDTILLNTSELTGMEIDPSARRARVGAGTRWGEVIEQLSDAGLAALHGSSPDVGVVGYSLGGGIGWLSRRYGLQSNSVTAVELVTAEGDHVRCDAAHEPELFWALRGGGGNFGVVTAIEFAVHPVEQLYAGTLLFEFSQAAEVMHAWRGLLTELPEEMTTWLSLMHVPDLPFVPEPLRGGSFTAILGTFVGSEQDGRELLRPLRALEPTIDTFAMVPPAALGGLAMDPPDPVPYLSGHQLLDELPGDAAESLVTVADRSSQLVALQFRHVGGALAVPPPGAGALATLPGQIAWFGLGIAADRDSAATVSHSLAAVHELLAPHEAGLSPNFVERASDPHLFYDSATWDRLCEAKARYDGADVFVGNHHIPPAD